MDQLAESLEKILSNGSFGGAFLALGLAYLGGILSSLTPCIYPMIPITIGVIGGIQTHHEERNVRGVFLRGVAYVLGMAIVYSFLGVLAGLTGQVFGSLTNTPGWYIGLSMFMTVAALVMMDILPLDPQAIRVAIHEILAGAGKRGRVPELWDGCAAERICDEVLLWAARSRPGVSSDQAGSIWRES